MNSEELEHSLRAEFETYLSGVMAKMREDVTEFQIKIESEFEKHKSQIDESFRHFSERFDSEHEFDQAFTESVEEHLRLARDDGARITATAIAEAEAMEQAARPEFSLADLKTAIDDISSKDSQSSILKSLIQHAANYTPRGAFFVIKNEHFVGWKVFGKEAGDGESAVRDIHFPVAEDSILGAAVRALSTVDGSFGTYTDDKAFLDPLQFGQPDRMHAIPLVARGRGVAVLYCDYGHEGVSVNTDALEMLVRVAGLTVEMIASAKAAQSGSDESASADFTDSSHDVPVETPVAPTDLHSALEHAHDVPATPAHDSSAGGFAFTPDFVAAPEYTPSEMLSTKTPHEFEAPASELVDETPASIFDTADSVHHVERSESTVPTYESAEFETTQPFHPFEPVQEATPPLDSAVLSSDLHSFKPADEPVHEFETTQPVEFDKTLPAVESAPITESAIVFDAPVNEEKNPFEASPFDSTAERFEPAGMIGSSGAPVATAAPVVEKVAKQPVGSRLSDRHVDLPIEVAEDERRLHNDARRFARLLVSEIKLYNEKKVQEGRESNDLYERLREAIDRSREMYDKRVQPPVAAKFDYFHYEIVNSLADGEETRLGNGYPGTSV